MPAEKRVRTVARLGILILPIHLCDIDEIAGGNQHQNFYLFGCRSDVEIKIELPVVPTHGT